MGLRFRKSVKIAPGVKLNLGKKSSGISFGTKGMHYSVNSNGRRTKSVGIPGTGISYVSSEGGSSSESTSRKSTKNPKIGGTSKIGCMPIAILAVIILFIIGGIGSCVGGDDEEITFKSSTGIEEIEFSNSDPLELYVGETDRGHVNVDYDNEFNEYDIVFVSSNENVVTISFDYKGYSSVHYDVEAVGVGTATIYAETSDGIVKSEEITVTVSENKVVSIEFPDYESLEFEVGATDSGYVNVDCEGDFSEDDIVFVSSDVSVVAISFDIKGYSKVYYDLEAVGAGVATIYAQTVDGAVKSEEITVTVTEDTVKKTEATEAKTVTADETETPKATATAKEYVLNTNTMKIHESYCSSVKDIDPGNYAETSDYDKAISQGYVPCKRCNP